MRTRLSPEFQRDAAGEQANAILRSCVHCGLCNATCPTYRLLGDELDGPRGRIYLIKQALEGAPVTRLTQLHLDRCLTCLNCETTCPSAVRYGRLLEIGRRIVDERVPRPLRERAARWLLREGLTSRWFAPAAALGRRLAPLVPRVLRDKLPRKAEAAAACAPRAALRVAPRRRVWLLKGCVQPTLAPNIDAATVRVLAAAGIDGVYAPNAGCCGAMRAHLSDPGGALADMRRNIDAWWPAVAAGEVDAIVVNASACGLALKDYGRALAADAAYAAKASAIAQLARDLSELLPDMLPALQERVRNVAARPLAYHAPCTLRHGHALQGAVEPHLRALGFRVETAPVDADLCCGSAGAYSVLQPSIARALRDRKLQALGGIDAECIVSANIGCIQHLQSGSAIPVRHWVEAVDSALVQEAALGA